MSVGTYPGVYIKELSSGVHTIVGVGTSIGMFIGRSALGELNKPVRCLSLADFEREFSSKYAKSDLARAVKLFFDNGGSDCYVMRTALAGSAAQAVATLKDEAKVDALKVTAKSAGPAGNDIRVHVDYDTASPEGSFNLEVFRWVPASNGVLQKSQVEFYPGLSMDVGQARYCEDVVNTVSKLVRLDDLRKATALTGNGASISGYAVSARTSAIFQVQVQTLLTASQNKFRLSVGGRPPALIDLSSVVPLLPLAQAALQTQLTTTINAQLPPGAAVLVTFENGPTGPGAQDNATSRLMVVQGVNADAVVESAASDDLARPMMLGTANGGIELARSGARRPAPNAVVTHADFGAFPGAPVFPNAYTNFGSVVQATVDAVRVAGVELPLLGPQALQTAPPALTPPMYQDKSATTANDGRDGVREKLRLIAAAVNDKRAADVNFQWTAQVWGSRLALIAAGDVADLGTTALDAGFRLLPYPPPPFPLPFPAVANVFDMAGQPVTANIRYFPLGFTAPGTYHAAGVLGTEGLAPTTADYEAAYKIIDREVDLFNLLVLPRDADHNNAAMRALWGPASNFCERKRAFLLIDPPPDWVDHLSTVDASIGVNTLRVGLSKQYSAIYFPNLTIREGDKEIAVGPSGAMAGVMARIDASRGVWKAAAGTEADLHGVVGVQRRLSDGENGVMNPQAVNAIRLFPSGVVAWGARTMDGTDTFGSEYKYSCIRRLANFIEESTYRGLTWAVFEPNDEPLWSQIRLNVGAFMHNLFRQGAFQGQTPRDAYFVRCDSTTTTQNDINLGIVNIVVGFAPLKPAEFIVLYLQQIAGQIQA